MEQVRKRFQGVTNIVRFNWHFYLVAVLAVLLLFVLKFLSSRQYALYLNGLAIVLLATTFISLLVSFYIYDVSELYTLNWLDAVNSQADGTIVNIHAGFDETSQLLKAKFPDATLLVFDFYDQAKHTEVSIQRARRTYPPFAGTEKIATSHIPLQNYAADVICLILSAHEIRNNKERILFFKELRRIVKPSGKIVVTEHMRDLPNFLAYNIGALHFLSPGCWRDTFKEADLCVSGKVKITPFITTYILTKHGTAS